MYRELAAPERQNVPGRALVISVLSLGVPVASSFRIPDWTSSEMGMLVWLTALIPAFLLAYYRGIQGVAVALAGGMAVITATQLSISMYGIERPDFKLLLSIVGIYLAISLGMAVVAELLQRERRAAEQLALFDRLTGLPNRRLAELTLDSAFAAAERGSRLTVVLFDLDRFKKVNDNHGHSAGDQALARFGEVLTTMTRREDLSARFGGEEFVSVLRNKNAEGASHFVSRVLKAIREEAFPWGTQTVSAGVAEYEKGMGSFEILVAAADRALYEAKARGRDCFVIANEALKHERPQQRVSVTAPAFLERDSQPASTSLIVVEDDDGLRSAIVRAIRRMGGFEVWDTGDPLDAVEHFRRSPIKPQLVLTDISMPQLSGITMMHQMEEIDPDVKAVYMSGYNQSKIDWPGMPGSVVAFLSKPIELDELVATLRAVASRSQAEEPSLMAPARESMDRAPV